MKLKRRAFGKRIAVSIFLIALPATAFASEAGKSLKVATDSGDMRDPRAAAALEKLEFLLGDWDIASSYALADGSSVQSQARMNGHFTMGGFAIETQSVHSSLSNPNNDIFVSAHIYMVHPKTGKIAAVAINTLGNRKFNDGEFTQGDFTVIASGEMFNGSDHIERTRYFNIAEDRFETASEVSEDGGKTWRDGGYSSVFTRAK
ncbi:hypothetical protein [Hyphococcus sp.]|uniref:hypothetical protein n=1 Tax=Hyphococcus sp. TaxID=2038636 RepID=UPI0020805312|nr:MAG: hypothetical protein DHS20C04_25790 [Marinicaulis sp.]